MKECVSHHVISHAGKGCRVDFEYVDTGSKPFKCGICSRSFTRGDVLNRHIKGHQRSDLTRKDFLSQNSEALPLPFPAVVTEHEPQSLEASLGTPLPSAPGGQSQDHQTGEVDPTCWSHSSATTYDSLMQVDESSSLLWPDSEDFFQSLTASHGIDWNQSAPGLTKSAVFQTGPSAMAPPSPNGEPTVTEDGNRAVQTTNGLLTNTVFRTG